MAPTIEHALSIRSDKELGRATLAPDIPAPEIWRTRQWDIFPLTVLTSSVVLLALLEYKILPALDSAWLRGTLHAVLLAGIVQALVRVKRHARFRSELLSMLKQIHAGERTQRFYFKHAHSIQDRSLALAFSETLKSLHRRLRALVDERSSEEVIIAAMAEGVLGVDTRERIIRLNPAAAELLNTSPDEALGRAIQEVVRSSDLQRFVRAVLQGKQPEQSEVMLHGTQERSLQMSGRELLSSEGEKIGAIVVLSDITRLRNLERARSDFIANVSHELKTPVTSIQGFAETLLDGAMENPADARKFLGIITKQAQRLGQIFDEMLVLSRLEQEEQVTLTATELKPILVAAVQSCEHRAQGKDSEVEVECAADLRALCHAPLLEHAVSNLVDNAIKYSPTGSSVKVLAERQGEEISVAVHDNGPGIEPQHLPRIFERFYRVDKGRSRAEGGTGLGLAIVKHIAQVHGGRSVVTSIPRKGSTFTIMIKADAALAPRKDSDEFGE